MNMRQPSTRSGGSLGLWSVRPCFSFLQDRFLSGAAGLACSRWCWLASVGAVGLPNIWKYLLPSRRCCWIAAYSGLSNCRPFAVVLLGCVLACFSGLWEVSFGSQPALKGAAVAVVNLDMWQALGILDVYQLQAWPRLEIRIDARMHRKEKQRWAMRTLKPAPGQWPDNKSLMPRSGGPTWSFLCDSQSHNRAYSWGDGRRRPIAALAPARISSIGRNRWPRAMYKCT